MESVELHEIPTRQTQTRDDHDHDEYAQSAATISSGENRVVPCRSVTVGRIDVDGTDDCINENRDNNGKRGLWKGRKIWGAISGFWTSQVVLVVPQKKNRDHYGMFLSPCITYDQVLMLVGWLALERTFLAYIRTSVVLSMQGVLVAQLFRLQRSRSQEAFELTYYEVAIPLSIACHCVALVVVTLGAFRFWRQQHAMFRGRVHAGGWELNSIGMLISLVSLRYRW